MKGNKGEKKWDNCNSIIKYILKSMHFTVKGFLKLMSKVILINRVWTVGARQCVRLLLAWAPRGFRPEKGSRVFHLRPSLLLRTKGEWRN